MVDARPRPRPRDEFWTERTVAWYERADARGDYAARVLAAVPDVLAGCRSALDVGGAGFGALALPLARRLDRVTALEPAPAMAAALRRAVRRHALSNVVVIEAAMAPCASTGDGWSLVRLERMDCISKGSLNRCGWVKRMHACSSTSRRSAVTYL